MTTLRLHDGTPLNRVVVTGGSGMLGSHVVDRLVDMGVPDVVVVDRQIDRANLDAALSSGRVSTVEADLRAPGVVQGVLGGADAVVHLAGVLMRAAKTDPRQAFEVNVVAGHEILWQAVELGVRRVIIGSSVGVYGAPESDAVITESSAILARTSYGAAKFCIELSARALAEESGLDYVALRLGTLYGDRLHDGGFYPSQLLTLLRQADSARLTVEGDPDELHDVLYVGDAADAVVSALLGSFSDVSVNIVSGSPVTWRAVVEQLLATAGSAAELSWVPRKDVFATHRRFSGALAVELMGFVPKASLAEGMRALVDWYGATS